MYRYLITIPGIDWPITSFGVALFLAFVLVLWWGMRRGLAIGMPREKTQDLALTLFLTGIIGARIVYMIQYRKQFPGKSLQELLVEFVSIWNGGIVFYGSVLGGLLGFIVFNRLVLRRFKLDIWQLADVIAPLLALGLAVGRIGCYLNGCCWGQVAVPEAQPVPLAGSPGQFPLLPAYCRDQLCRLPSPDERLPHIHGLQTSTGFSVRPTSTVPPFDPRSVVVAVEPGSSAEAAGLKAGDQIIEVDGMPNDIILHLTGEKTKLKEAVDALAAAGGRIADDGKLKSGYDYAKIAYSDPVRAEAAKNLANNFPGVSANTTDELVPLITDWSDLKKGQARLALKVNRNGTEIPVSFRPVTMTLYPTQLYETISMVLLVFLLVAFQPFRRHDGQVMVLLMVGYAVHRFLNEAIRIEPSYSIFGIDYGLTLSQWVSVLILLAAVALEVYLRLTRPKLPPGPQPLGYNAKG
jgi:prolipoprotein diacylglyceryltransferase